MSMGVSQHFCCQCPYPQGEPQLLHTYRRPSNTSRQAWFSLLQNHYPFPLDINVHKIVCVPSKSLCFPQSQRSPEIRFHQPSKSYFLVSLVPLVYLQAGKHELGLRTFTIVGKILWFNCFPVCGLTTWLVWDLTLS